MQKVWELKASESYSLDQLLVAARQGRLPGNPNPVEVRQVAHDETTDIHVGIIYYRNPAKNETVSINGAFYAGSQPEFLRELADEKIPFKGRTFPQIRAHFILRNPVVVIENYLSAVGQPKYRLTVCHSEWQTDDDPELSMGKILSQLRQRDTVLA